ncbi:MAG TPA: IPT/TIG domain-containing protein [Pyrinomonadaceae bacterium]
MTVAAFCFPTVVPFIFQKFFAAAVQLITGARMLFYNLQTSIKAACDNPEAKTGCFGQMGSGFVETATGITGTILTEIKDVPINRLIGFLAVWALISFLLDDRQASEEGGSRGLNSLRQLYANRNTPVVRNTMFFIILGVSSFLSMAAILAIPELEAKSVVYEQVSLDKLKAQLNDSSNTLAAYTTNFDESKMNAVDTAIESLKADGETTPQPKTEEQTSTSTTIAPQTNSANSGQGNTTTNGNVNAVNGGLNTRTALPTNSSTQPQFTLTPEKLNRLKELQTDNKAQTTALISDYQKIVEDAKKKQEVLRSNVQQSYEVNSLVGKGNKERLQYFLNLTNWFSRTVTERNRVVSECVREIQMVNDRWQRLGSSVSQAQNRPNYIDNLDDEMYDLYYGISRARGYCASLARESENLESGKMPQMAKLGEGSDLGIFYYFTFWLLKTESLSFALITGLLGFGLLGSACSTFIREHIQKNTAQQQSNNANPEPHADKVLVNDLTEVVVRGVAAAVVVFLALQGGLAIFSSGNGQPNSYVLLLTCLVAAVFSESIWKRVQEELGKRLKEQDGNEDKPQTPQNGGNPPESNTPISCVIEPVKGLTGGKVTITGTGFKTIKSVLFGEMAAIEPVIDESSSVITATIPEHKKGVVQVTVESGEGHKAVTNFEYLDD